RGLYYLTIGHVWQVPCLLIARWQAPSKKWQKTRGNEMYKSIAKFSRTIVAVALATLALGAYSAKAATTHDQVVDQSRIEKEVRHSLVAFLWYGVFDNLKYRVSGTEVVLSGQVVQPVTKPDAKKAARHVEGVTHVVNNTTVLPLSRFDDQPRRAE